MATVSTIIQEVVSRIESLTPTLNPTVRYGHLTTNIQYAKSQDRQFRILPKLNYIPNNNPSRDPTIIEIEINVYYTRPTEQYRKLLDIADDLNELYGHLIYTQNSEWSSNMNVIIEDTATIINDDLNNYFYVSLTLQLHYFRS